MTITTLPITQTYFPRYEPWGPWPLPPLKPLFFLPILLSSYFVGPVYNNDICLWLNNVNIPNSN